MAKGLRPSLRNDDELIIDDAAHPADPVREWDVFGAIEHERCAGLYSEVFATYTRGDKTRLPVGIIVEADGDKGVCYEKIADAVDIEPSTDTFDPTGLGLIWKRRAALTVLTPVGL